MEQDDINAELKDRLLIGEMERKQLLRDMGEVKRDVKDMKDSLAHLDKNQSLVMQRVAAFGAGIGLVFSLVIGFVWNFITGGAAG